MKKTSNITFATEANGSRIALIPLANTQRKAIIDADDIETLRSKGVSLAFHLNSNGSNHSYVRAPRSKRNKVMVVRAITDAKPYEEHVHYRDGNRENLRRENLIVCPGRRCTKECEHWSGQR